MANRSQFLAFGLHTLTVDVGVQWPTKCVFFFSNCSFKHLLKRFPQITCPLQPNIRSQHVLIHHMRTQGPAKTYRVRRFIPRKRLAYTAFQIILRQGTIISWFPKLNRRIIPLWGLPRVEYGYGSGKIPCTSYPRLYRDPSSEDNLRNYWLVPISRECIWASERRPDLSPF